jgi:hypothetical protein
MHLPALSRLRIKVDTGWYLSWNSRQEWEYLASVKLTFRSKNIHLEVTVPPSFNPRYRPPVDTSWMTSTAVKRSSTSGRFRSIKYSITYILSEKIRPLLRWESGLGIVAGMYGP